MEWTYKLSEEGNPLIRLGIHGLYRLLKHGEGDSRFPAVKQGDVCWELGEDSIKLTFKSQAQLIPLMRGMLGDFADGAARLPGYEKYEYGMLVCACAHVGIASMSAATAQRRSRVLKGAEIAAWFRHTGFPAPKKDKVSISRGGEGQEIGMTVSPQMPLDGFFPEGVEEKGKPLSHSTRFGSQHHPYFSTWYNAEPKADAQQSFVALFAVLAHAWTQNGFVAFGVDLPTFQAADRAHDRHAQEPLLRLGGGPQFNAWALATHLGLPDRTYVVLHRKPDGVLFYRPGAYDPMSRRLLHAIAQNAIGPYTANKITNTRVKSLHFVPVEEHGDTKVTLQDLLLENLSTGQFWGSGLQRMVSLRTDGKRKESILYPREANQLKEIMKIMGNNYDLLWRQAMVYIKGRIAAARRERGSAKPWEKAHQTLVDIILPRITNEGSFLTALAEMAKEAGRTDLMVSAEMLQYMRDLVRRDPSGARGFLLAASLLRYGKEEQDVRERETYFQHMGWNLKSVLPDEVELAVDLSEPDADDTVSI